MTTTTLGGPAELELRLRHTLPPHDGGRPVVQVIPRDDTERKCAAWCSDHYEVQAHYTATDHDALGSLERALQELPGVYATTQVFGSAVTNPDWPAAIGVSRRGLRTMRPQVLALMRDEEPEQVTLVEPVEPVEPEPVAPPTTTTAGSTFRDAATTLWGEAGAHTHDAYRRWLPLFPELPDELPIVIGLTAYGRCIGLTRPDWEHGPRITIASPHFKDGRGAVDDVMVHEMLHAWLHLTGQNTDHAGDDWYAAVRRLSPAVLGHRLDVSRGADRKSVRVKLDDGTSAVRKVRNPDAVPHSAVARWPQAFRPEGYDYGEPINCPTY